MPNRIDYRQFGQNLLDQVITEKRINDIIDEAVGGEIKVAGGLAKIKLAATKTLNDFQVVPEKLPELCFAVRVTVGFDLDVRMLLVLNSDFKGSIEVSTQGHVQTLDPLTVFVDVAPLSKANVKVVVDGEDLPAELFDGLVQGEIRDRVIDEGNKLLADPGARTFDLAIAVERMAEGLAAPAG